MQELERLKSDLTLSEAPPADGLPPVPITSRPGGPPSQAGKKARVLYEYEAAEDNEIALQEGETITQIEELDEGWWSGTNSLGQSGLFPANYCEMIEEDNITTEPEPVAAVPLAPPAPPIAPGASTANRETEEEEEGETQMALFECVGLQRVVDWTDPGLAMTRRKITRSPLKRAIRSRISERSTRTGGRGKRTESKDYSLVREYPINKFYGKLIFWKAAYVGEVE